MDNAGSGALESTGFEGEIRSDLLGNISTHLSSLQGFDVMALELIQNADDAGAKIIRFDITPDHLGVWNDGEFEFCGAMATYPCPWETKSDRHRKNSACDFHQITVVARGGKLSNPDNIGRFGIGFISTYQITDAPKIISTNHELTLFTGSGRYQFKPHAKTVGTRFILSWARDADTPTRQRLRCSSVDEDLINNVQIDIAHIISRSLLFLKNVTTAELYNGTTLVARCQIDRSANQSKEARDISVKHEPLGAPENWLILQSDAKDFQAPLLAKFPILQKLGRRTHVQIAIRVAPGPLETGYLYAFLPTKQTTQLPLHINADFFPTPSREKVIFDGQHERAWNEGLIQAAANTIAANVELLCQRLGHKGLWNLIHATFLLRGPASGETPSAYASYWKAIDSVLDRQPKIVLTSDRRSVAASEVSIPSANANLTEAEAGAFRRIGGNLVAESLRPFSSVLTHMLAKPLSLEHLLTLLDNLDTTFEMGRHVPDGEITTLFKPLWQLADRLIREAGNLPAIRKQNLVEQLKMRPIAIDNSGVVSSLSRCFNVSTPFRSDFEIIFPDLRLVSSDLSQKQELVSHCPPLSFAIVVRHMKKQLETPDGWRAPTDSAALTKLYQLLQKLDNPLPGDQESIDILRKLPIWRCGSLYINAESALLPGDFSDPIGYAQLIDADIINSAVRTFLEERLGVAKQSPKAFIDKVVPRIFTESSNLTTAQYKLLILQLSNHLSLLDDSETLRKLQELRMAPTQDGNWQLPPATYFRSDHLAKILGEDSTHLWLDSTRAPSQPSAQKFLERLGVRREPSALTLVNRIIELSQRFKPTQTARKIAQEPFYELCSRYSLWVALEDEKSVEAANTLSAIACLPALGKEAEWFSASELYAPYQAKAFESQALILAYQDTKRLKTDFLESIGLSINPETKLVVDHLLYCIRNLGTFDPKPIYEVLNQQALKESEGLELRRLAEESCIAVGPGRFVRPNRVFWGEVHLPGFAFSLSSDWDRYKQLFSVIGVKESPSAEDFAEIVLELLEDADRTQTPLSDSRLDIYRQCLESLSAAHAEGTLQAATCWTDLSKSPLALDLKSRPNYPDELLLLDSEWLYLFFGEDIAESLSRAPVEYLPLFADLGMSRLSENAKVEIDVIESIEEGHSAHEIILHERVEAIARVLHDKRRELVERISEALMAIRVATCDVLRVIAVAQIEGAPQFSEPKSVPTFYSPTTNVLTIKRPFVDDLWVHSFNAILHQLLSQEVITDVAKLSMICAQIMERPTLESCHRFLDIAGIPPLQDLTNPIDELDRSEEIGLSQDEAEANTPNAPTDEDDHSAPEDNVKAEPESPEMPGIDSDLADLPGVDASPVPPPATEKEREAKDNFDQASAGTTPARPAGANADLGHTSTTTGTLNGNSQSPVTTYSGQLTSANRRKGRGKHKIRRDEAFRTYVRPENRSDNPSPDDSENSEAYRYRLALEMASREIVCRHEAGAGRTPDQMGQKNPGYDIISTNARTGERRYIEVKAINGEWNKAGVSLSRTQFNNAQNLGDQYWLYVVEYALDPFPAVAKVHPIQNPALKTQYFFFDSGWRGLSENTKGDPLDAFVVDARGMFGTWGKGTIKKRNVSEHGSVSLIVDIDGKGETLITPRVANNHMRIFAPGEES